MLKAIVCCDNNWGIGKDDELLFHIPLDMQFFKKTTLGHIVIMGKKTFDSLPHKPLVNRQNIILTHQNIDLENCIVFNNFFDLFSYANAISRIEDVFIIGGEQIYTLFYPNFDEILLTQVDTTLNANKFFPHTNFEDNFKLINKSLNYHFEQLDFCFNRFARVERQGTLS